MNRTPAIWIGNQSAFAADMPLRPFEYALANGFDAFEWFPDKKPSGAGWDETDLSGEKRCGIRDAANARGMKLSVHARWQANPLHPSDRPLLLKDVELARDLGAGLLNLHLFAERGLPEFAEAITWLIGCLPDPGMRLAIENTPQTAPELFNELFAQLDGRAAVPPGRVGMCLDLGHANLYAATRNNFLQYLDRLDRRVPIIHLHLHENWGDADTHLPLFTGPAGRDDSGVRGLLERLRRRNFSGAIILEQWPEPPALLNQARERLLRLWGDLPAPDRGGAGLPVSPALEGGSGNAETVCEPNRAPTSPSPPRSGGEGRGEDEPSSSASRATPLHEPERRSPDRQVDVGQRPQADQEIGAPIGRFMVPERTSGSVEAGHEPGSEAVPAASSGGVPPPVETAAGDARAARAPETLVAADQRSRSWREKLASVLDLLAVGSAPPALEQLVEVAIYLRFLGTGAIPCAEDGRHFRPVHHAQIAERIQEHLSRLTDADVFIVRQIYPWLPSSAPVFRRAEPLTRIRDIAHRNDIPADLKREIKHSLQNKLHRCAGPEDLATSAALLERITRPGANHAPAFVEQFKIFHEELKEFFNARSLDERLAALLPAVKADEAAEIRQFLAAKAGATLAAQEQAFRLLTGLRQKFLQAVAQKPGAGTQDLLMADLGLEDFAFVLLSEMINALDAEPAPPWSSLLDALLLTVCNLALSGVEPAECRVIEAELLAWERDFDPKHREHLLRVKATADRARRLAEDFCDRIVALFSPRAEKLGRDLGVADHAIRAFCDAEIRSHVAFQLSKLVSSLLRHLRETLALPAWDVLVSGETTGRLHAAEWLGDLEGSLHEPAVVLLKDAEGDEEIPRHVAAIVLSREIPHLSHLGVRARQAGVVLVASEQPANLQQLRALEGRTIRLAATAESVNWEVLARPASPAPAEPVPAGAGNAAARGGRAPPQILEADLTSDRICVPLHEITPERGGGKAVGAGRLAELARREGAGFKTPPGLVIPFGVMEQALRASPALDVEYGRQLNQVDGGAPEWARAGERLASLVRCVYVPDEIARAVAGRFPPGDRLMVRSSANGEDLEELSGAGLYESVANVAPANAAAAVRTVWASLWTRRAVASRRQAGIPHRRAHMAVLVQQMLVPDLSFIMHTVNPVNHDPREAYVEIAVGHGETLASAGLRGNPYRLVCHKETGTTVILAFASFSQALWPDPAGGLRRETVDYSQIELSRTSAARQKLGRRLADIALRVEGAFGRAQDIEGVVTGDDIYLVQSRPQQGLNARP